VIPGRNAIKIGIGISLLLVAVMPLGAQVHLPALPTAVASEQGSALTAAQVSKLAGSQNSEVAGGQNSPFAMPETSNGPFAKTSSTPQRPRISSAPRITSTPVPPQGSADIGGAIQIPGVSGGSVPWSIVVMLTALTLVPSILVCMTPFARLLIVFHFLRQALGLQTTPSNQTLIGLSLILTFFLMQPVATQIYTDALVPMEANQITALDALSRAEVPMSHFMAHYVRDKDVALFTDIAHEPHPASINDVSMRVLLPAYILSELKAGFQIGTVLFLPFLIVDMVVASITTSVGMLQLPPVVISTPLKLLLFLMVDGWHLLIGSLMRSFQ
jgi:flagellar biosynthetic protein FliP